MVKQQLISLSDITTAHRVRESEFFAQINTLIDWHPIEKLLHYCYRKGKSRYNDEVIAERGLKTGLCSAMSGDARSHIGKEFSTSWFHARDTKLSGRLALCGDGLTRARHAYVGLEKTHSQHLLEAMAHNLYRAPRVIVSTTEK